MANSPSLFAEKLRAWRTRHGRHGRVSQQALAEILGVSVDAIGKYERSLSFIRGDLEHRLSDRLGWSQHEILSCREDWQSRRNPRPNKSYRLLDETGVQTLFDGSWSKAIHAMIAIADTELGRLPNELSANQAVFHPIYDTYRRHWAAVTYDDQIVAKWSLLLLNAENEAQFKAGRLNESELSVDGIRRPILPGTYFGYCPALIICRDHEPAAPLLLASFIRLLEDFAARGVLLSGLGAITCSTSGAQLSDGLGMVRLCDYYLDADYGVWELAGADISTSLLGRRSAKLCQHYTNAFRSP